MSYLLVCSLLTTVIYLKAVAARIGEPPKCLMSTVHLTLPNFKMIKIHSFMGRSTPNALKCYQDFGGVRQICFSTHEYMIHRSTSFWNTVVQDKRERIINCNSVAYLKPSVSRGRSQATCSINSVSNFHSSTTMLMMSKRKKNGGKSRRSKLLITTTENAVMNSVDEEPVIDDITVDSLDHLFLEKHNKTDIKVSERQNTLFASEYHAPVMLTECIQALLKQGEWENILQAKRNRWRKKRNNIEAKGRRLGYVGYSLDDDDDDDYVADTDNGKVDSMITTDELQLSHEIQQSKLFIDGTLGGGGHSQAILEQLNPGDVLIGCDVDRDALVTSCKRLSKYLATKEYIHETNMPTDGDLICQWEKSRPMFIPVQSNFRNLITSLSKLRHPVTGRLLLGDRRMNYVSERDSTVMYEEVPVEFPNGANGMLLDLGVSSYQINTSERGFAFMKEGPLDMRMSGNFGISSNTTIHSSITAADICNEFDEPNIISILQNFGDEPRAKRIASAIVASRPLNTTTDLVHAINSVTPTFARQRRAGLIATCARVFQALRIVVNEEDGALKDVLEVVAPWVLRRGGGVMNVGNSEEIDSGMLVVLSYHSMEDKMVKRVMRDGSVGFLDGDTPGGVVLERDIFGNMVDKSGGRLSDLISQCPFEPLGKPQKASEEEIATNSRARSATLRVGIRIGGTHS